jgi:hypothetical protein
MVLNASIDSRDDGFNRTNLLSPEEAFNSHWKQIEIFIKTNVDMITGLIIFDWCNSWVFKYVNMNKVI